MNTAGTVEEGSSLGIAMAITPSIITVFLFLSPLPTIMEIIDSKTTGTLPGLPYLACALQSLVWVCYGILEESPSVYACNIVGVCSGFFYMLVFHKYSSEEGVKKLYKLYFIGCTMLILTIGLFLQGIQTQNSELLGYLGMVGGLVFTLSPLVTITEVFKTKSVASMPFALTLLVFVNGCAWASFGWFVANDLNLYVTNGVAAISGMLQLLCHVMYGNILRSFAEIFVACIPTRNMEPTYPMKDNFEIDKKQITQE